MYDNFVLFVLEIERSDFWDSCTAAQLILFQYHSFGFTKITFQIRIQSSAC